MSFSRLETERLVLRRFQDDDVEPLFTYRSDPQIARFQLWPPVDRETARGWVEGVKDGEPGAPGRWFQFAIELRSSGQMVGDVGLRADLDPRTMELGFTLARDHQGQGYATEAVRAVLDLAFALGAHRITGNCDARNEASARLMERVGMRREAHHVEDWWLREEWTSSFIYAVLAREWRRS